MDNIRQKKVGPRKNITVLLGRIEFYVNGVKVWVDFKDKTTDIYLNEVLLDTRNDRKLMFTQVLQMVSNVIVPLEYESVHHEQKQS